MFWLNVLIHIHALIMENISLKKGRNDSAHHQTDEDPSGDNLTDLSLFGEQCSWIQLPSK